MQKSQSVSEALQALESKGYHLADTFSEQPEGLSQPHDWRLDSVEKVQEDGRNALLVAVSSPSRGDKLVFVESAPSNASFSPVTLLRKLFPKRNP
ncbi:MAG: hypothetical protein H7246_02745 [Phycisphaerae bacterium]|nr:hypothetical protein [Saprospiraceae bacterium]